MSGKPLRIIKDDKSKLNAILKDFKDLKGSYVKIGYIEGDKSHKSKKDRSKKHSNKNTTYINMAQLASVHEYGSPKKGIPERSFIRSWVDNNQPEIMRRIERMVKGIIDGKVTPEIALKTIGVFASGGIKKQLKSISTPPLSEKTIKEKGSSQPLIDTGQMRSSIRFIVKKNSFLGKITGKLK